jgi:hypothetical protein
MNCIYDAREAIIKIFAMRYNDTVWVAMNMLLSASRGRGTRFQALEAPLFARQAI